MWMFCWLVCNYFCQMAKTQQFFLQWTLNCGIGVSLYVWLCWKLWETHKQPEFHRLRPCHSPVSQSEPEFRLLLSSMKSSTCTKWNLTRMSKINMKPCAASEINATFAQHWGSSGAVPFRWSVLWPVWLTWELLKAMQENLFLERMLR